jgi:AraC-like DNA-binding protein
LKQKAKQAKAFQAHSYLFLAYVSLGKTEEAFTWLDQALQMNSSVLLLTYSDPLAEELRKDPRYPDYHYRLYGNHLNNHPPDLQTIPLLDAETSEEYTVKLFDFMRDEQPFLNPGLSLRGLADQVQIHPNQLSWLLNQQLKRNFNEFVNHYRVEHFKKIAIDPANAHISLIGLAYESGFNSKTVFNTSFKKETGMTPSRFLKG